MADENLPPPASRGTNEGLVLDNTMLRIDKGRVAPPSDADQEPRAPHVDHIPWGYGRDVIKAMVVDPNRLYLYWEVTDPGIAKARQGLGPGGKDAWLSLRIYDTTGRIFDGTNAHGYIDIKVERSDRQWFVHIGKPASTHVVEIGLKSLEGYFVRIARSGRADFPRFEPSSDGTVDWLSVRTATGPVGDPSRGAAPAGGSAGGQPANAGGAHAAAANGPLGIVGAVGVESKIWQEQTTEGPVHLTEWSWQGWQEVFHTQWIEGRRFLEWSTPLLRTNWEAGPFPFAVESPGVVEEHFEGPVTVYPLEGGRTRVVYGPWQVTIRGLGAKAEGRVIARWQVETSWVVSIGFERVVRELSPGAAPRAPGDAAAMMGSSAVGASERRWLSASELRLMGASELYTLSASELRLRGASEMVLGGASERRIQGASERRLLGASENGWGGASELTSIGASENLAASPYAIDEGEHPSQEKRRGTR